MKTTLCTILLAVGFYSHSFSQLYFLKGGTLSIRQDSLNSLKVYATFKCQASWNANMSDDSIGVRWGATKPIIRPNTIGSEQLGQNSYMKTYESSFVVDTNSNDSLLVVSFFPGMWDTYISNFWDGDLTSVSFYIEAVINVRELIKGKYFEMSMNGSFEDIDTVGRPALYSPELEVKNSDSVSVVLIRHLLEHNIEMMTYQFPDEAQFLPTVLNIQPSTGDIVWDKPVELGTYCFVFKANTYNGGSFLCSTMHMMLMYVKGGTAYLNSNLPTSNPPITLHPNPATTTITLSGTEPGSTATITNLHGQVLLQSEIRSPQSDINISHLPAGFYFCTLQNGNRRQVQRFVRE